jgi:small redox-active disulfide protein 2
MNQALKQIVVFGANCGKCKKAEANIRSVLTKYQINAEVSKCDDWEIMVKNNVNYVPSVMIDNVLKFKGIVPSEKEILEVLTN